MVEKFYSDEELVAYLDGEAEFVSIQEIDLALKQDAALAKRLEQLTIDRKKLNAAFVAIPSPSFELPETGIASQKQKKPGLMTAAALAASLVVGLALGSIASFDNTPRWVSYVAAYQALYTTGTLSSVKLDVSAQEMELARVSASIGKSIKLDQLNVSPEIEYKRGQLLGFEGAALVQLAFLTKTGDPLALCIIRNGSDNSENVDLAVLEGMSSAYWRKDGYSYLLIGGKNSELVSRIAEKFISNEI